MSLSPKLHLNREEIRNIEIKHAKHYFYDVRISLYHNHPLPPLITSSFPVLEPGSVIRGRLSIHPLLRISCGVALSLLRKPVHPQP